MGRLRVVHKWSCEQLDMILNVLIHWWTNDQLVRILIAEVQWPDGLGALIESGAAYRESKDQTSIRYNQEELRENSIARWSEYIFFMSCTIGCIRVIIPCMGALDLCVEKEIYRKLWVFLLAHVHCGRCTSCSERQQPHVPYVSLH